MNELKSYTEYAVSTPTADFVIGFDFNYGEDAVNVTVDDVPATTAGYTVVYLNETTIRLSPSVPSGVVRLQRETDIDQSDHAYRAGAKFIAQTMDDNFKQVRKAQQEVKDSFDKIEEDTGTRLDGFYADVQEVQEDFLVVQATANTAELNASTALSNSTTALNTANAIDAKASTALLNANTALVTANGVDAKATDALDNSLTAELAATTALNTANGIDAKATAALGSATTALDTANTALNTANGIDEKASTALDTANAASTLASNALSKAANLSDLNSTTTARDNLGVYSKSEVNTAIASATPNATEAVAGKAKIATTAIAQEGTNDTDIITPLKLQQKLTSTVFGEGQAWVDVTSQRLENTTYTNTTGKPLLISVVTRPNAPSGASSVHLIVDGKIIIGSASYGSNINVYNGASTIVPKDKTYSFSIHQQNYLYFLEFS